MVHKNYDIPFNDLLSKDSSYSMHHRNIHSLATELCKVKNQWSIQFTYNIFENWNISYNFREQCDFF